MGMVLLHDELHERYKSIVAAGGPEYEGDSFRRYCHLAIISALERDEHELGLVDDSDNE